ncbi:MAG: DUF523 and DUF1722 domain-containing protein [Candidatus Omnitrophica bacterium]|nr:DUF523 and DUF1722 domain-containing protein [Candidatus Omnitrophota bacterium]
MTAKEDDSVNAPVRIGISACLLGEKVRYDGGHKLDRYLRDTVGRFVTWVGVCPEVECGLSVPREAMRLVGPIESPRLVTQKTGIDHTERMQRWAEKRVRELEKENLCGFIFKSGSPSSGMEKVRVYNAKGMPVKKGVGMFALKFMERFPLLPVEDDGRLQDLPLRENFISRAFVFRRWLDFLEEDGSLKGLVSFHTAHKLLIMSHSPKALAELGNLVARTKKIKRKELLEMYIGRVMDALKLMATVKKNANVLYHIAGYFKKQLTADEKAELGEIIGQYHAGLVPLIVPITLLGHYVRKHREPYLLKQVYLYPHPTELMLRNHV